MAQPIHALRMKAQPASRRTVGRSQTQFHKTKQQWENEESSGKSESRAAQPVLLGGCHIKQLKQSKNRQGDRAEAGQHSERARPEVPDRDGAFCREIEAYDEGDAGWEERDSFGDRSEHRDRQKERAGHEIDQTGGTSFAVPEQVPPKDKHRWGGRPRDQDLDLVKIVPLVASTVYAPPSQASHRSLVK